MHYKGFIIQSKNSVKHRKKKLGHSLLRQRPLRESRSHYGPWGANPDRPFRSMVDSSKQKQVTAIFFGRIPMFNSLLQPFFHDLPPSVCPHTLHQQVTLSHHISHLREKKLYLTKQPLVDSRLQILIKSYTSQSWGRSKRPGGITAKIKRERGLPTVRQNVG